MNRLIDELPSLVPDAEARAELLDQLGWTGERRVQIVEIRPDEELPGHAFSGFTSSELRQRYVSSGMDAARAVVSGLAPA